MEKVIKNQTEILQKLGIDKLNEMQLHAHEAISLHDEVIVLSPTGTGKTLAFLLPVIAQLDVNIQDIQALIVVPSRELATQIEQVARNMGSGYKINAVYGGRAGNKDKVDLISNPAILIGTPGRIADHLRNGVINLKSTKFVVLDEFDKSLEIGFQDEMHEIMDGVTGVKTKILTSATQKLEVPGFVRLKNPVTINFLEDGVRELVLKTVISSTEDKLFSLLDLLGHLGNQRGIIFCNFKESIQTLSNFLNEEGVGHTCFYGGLEQLDRERALIKFRNGTSQLLVATDLAARGIDVPELDFIVHFELPQKPDEFIHRNGRTARMNKKGVAYIMQWKNEELPSFIKNCKSIELTEGRTPINSGWETLYISGGRRDKISKSDIAGLFLKQGNLEKEELGIIELQQECTYVAVLKSKSQELVSQLNNSRLKKVKVRISVLK